MENKQPKNEEYILRVETESWLEWRSSLKRLFNLGYTWHSNNADIWKDNYYWLEGARYIYLDTRYKKLTRGGAVDPLKQGRLVDIKEIK